METKQKVITSSFINCDGEKIVYRNWHTGENPKGLLVIIHGLNSHSGLYHNFACQLVDHDFEVYAPDLRGHGQSGGLRFYIGDFNSIIEDIDNLITIATFKNPNIPLFLFGHNISAIFTSLYVIKNKEKCKGIILESIMLCLPCFYFNRLFIIILSRLAPYWRIMKLNSRHLSRDKVFIKELIKDPLLNQERQPARTLHQLMQAAELLKKQVPYLNLPVLLLHGAADRITDPNNSQYIFKRLKSRDKQLKIYEGHYHDLLNDKYNGFITKDIFRWLNDRI